MTMAWAPPTRRSLSRLLLPSSTSSFHSNILPWPAFPLAAAGISPTFPASHHGPHQCQCIASLATSTTKTNKSIKKKQFPGGSSSAKKAKPHKNIPRPAISGRVAYHHHKDEEETTRLENQTSPRKYVPLCSGCGVELIVHDDKPHLQTSKQGITTGINAVSHSPRKKKARYVDIMDYSYKTNATSSTTSLCPRCQQLQRDDIWSAYDALQDVDASVFTNQLSHIVHRRRFGLCLVVADATDPEFSTVRKLRHVIGGTPCILVLNKMDLLPRAKGRDVAFLRRQIQNIKYSPRMIDTFAVSASRGWGMVSLAEGILRTIAGRDVFVIGSANVGKSTLVKNISSLLVRTLYLKGNTDFRQRKEALTNLTVTSSHLPGTTLQAIRIPCFPSSHHALWDTPGIIQKGSLVYSLFPSHLMEPLARPTRMGVPTTEDGTKVRVGAGESILIEAGWIDGDGSDAKEDVSFTLARLDVAEDGGTPIDALAFVPTSLKVRVVPTTNAPTEASVPEEYIAQVERRVGNKGIFDGINLSKPLVIYKGDGSGVSEDGHLSFDVQRHAQRNGWINQDVVFASLGFIMLCHRRSFTVRPWVVQDSRYLKRPSLYPSNFENQILSDGDASVDHYDESMTDDDPRFNDIKQRLRMAYDKGRKLADVRGNRENAENLTMEDHDDYEFDQDWWCDRQ